MGRLRLLGAIPIIALLTVSACARPVGDFGRAEYNVLNDEVMPALGNAKGSKFNLADQEIEMRDRVWRYLVAPHAYDWFGDVAVEFQRTRLTPISNKPLKTRRYYDWLHSERFASSRVRYTRIEEDAIADIGMMPSAFASVCAVIELDRQRGIASNQITGLEDEVAINAAKRHAENRMVIEWFARSVTYRYESYSYALDHLLVETPHEEAVSANGRLSDLAVWVEAAGRGDFCGDFGSHGDHGKTAIRSRVLATVPDEGPYLK
ncbi:MAG: hypothetical protein ABIY37_08490 [Devosia sp.]